MKVKHIEDMSYDFFSTPTPKYLSQHLSFLTITSTGKVNSFFFFFLISKNLK